MAEIDDVARPRAGTLQKLRYFRAQLGKRRKQSCRVQIALNGGTVADLQPRLIDVDSPVHAHHVAARGMKFAEETRRPGTKVNHGRARASDPLDQRARV